MVEIVNFRDFGSYETREGAVKKGVFYRGASLAKISPDDLENLTEDLNVRTVIDLRSSMEVKEEPNQEGSYEYFHFDILKEMHQESAHPKDLIAKMEAFSPFENMRNLYRDIILSEHAQKMYAQIFDLLLEREGAFYIHCSAGKDRTGLAVSFILGALGVSKEDIVQEYLKSNEAAKQQVDYDAYRDNPRALEAAKVFSRVDEDYLRMAHDTILEISDSFSDYLEKYLDLDSTKQEALKAKFIF